MASATSRIATVTTYTGNKQQRRKGTGPKEKGFYQTQTTTLVGGGLKRETYRVDAKGQNSVKISESEVDAGGNVVQQKTLSTASEAEKRALSDPDSRLSKSINNQARDTDRQLDNVDVSNLDKAAGGSGNDATDDGGESQPAASQNNDAVEGTNVGVVGGTYPEDLAKTDQDVIKFDMLEYRPSQLEANGRPGLENIGKGDIIGESVILPIPGGLQDQNSAGWDSATMNPLERAAAEVALQAISKGGKGFTDSVEKQIKKTLSDGGKDAKDALAGYFAGQAAGVGQQVLQRGLGVVVNPNMELLFNSPSIRQFSFSFLLAPRSENETKEVANIIRFFKQGMSPIRSQSALFLRTPNTFRLRYIHRKSGTDSEHKYLSKFKECALLNTRVNYTPNSNYATFPDGGMVAYQLTLSFQELEPIFNNDYSGKEGIGY